MRWVVSWWAVACLAFPSVGAAQSTGASFGGGSWGSSSGSSSSRSSRSSRSSGSSWGSSSSGSSRSSGSSWGSSSSRSSRRSSSSGSSWDHSSSSHSSGSSQPRAARGGSGDGPWVFCFVVPFLLLLVVAIRVVIPTMVGTFPSPPTKSGIDVCALSIGVDSRARRFVQQRLEQLARGDTSSPAGLAGLLRATVETLTSVRLGWLYAGAHNAEPMPETQAQAEFLRIAADLRSRFRHELLRNADGALQITDAPELRARPEEGEGVVVVSLVVAACTDLPNLLQPRDAQALRQVLEWLGRLESWQLVAMEVIWSPAAEDDRMSTAELEALYPELCKIDEGTIGGPIFCPYCAGPYAAELAKCPHCGAPRPA